MNPFQEASCSFDGDPARATEFNDLALVPGTGADDDIVAVGFTEITNTSPAYMRKRPHQRDVLEKRQ